jgi:Putative Flp pilus-assembly TadE/G-like
MTTGLHEIHNISHPKRGTNVLKRKVGQRGFVLLLMTAASIGLLAAIGLAIDLGRVFITKNEAQAYADSEAVAASLWLNGRTTGIDNAISTVTSSTATYNFSSTDKWNMNTCSFLTSATGCTSTTPVVEVSTASSGATWYTTSASVPGGSVANILYVRVTTSVNMPLYFLPVLRGTTYTQNVKAQAIAGQVDITNFTQGLAPFSAIAENTTGPFFGLTVGTIYDIQWPQFNATRQQCNNGQPQNCFVSNPCPGDLASNAVLQSVAQDWGSSTNGYWGSGSGSGLADFIIGTTQLAAVPINSGCPGTLGNCFNMVAPNSCNISNGCMTMGNKQSSANYLDQRVNSDPARASAFVTNGNETDTDGTTTLTNYLADTTRNGLRMITVPMLYPSSTTSTPVVGYGQFLLISSLSSSTGSSDYYQTNHSHLDGYNGSGNDPYCAIYAGKFNQGSVDPGAGGSTGASRVKLVQ